MASLPPPLTPLLYSRFFKIGVDRVTGSRELQICPYFAGEPDALAKSSVMVWDVVDKKAIPGDTYPCTKTDQKDKTKGRNFKEMNPGSEKEQSVLTGVKVKKLRGTANFSKEHNRYLVDNEPLGLEMALPRRIDWTPPKARKMDTIDLTCEETINEDRSKAQNELSNMLGSFGYGPGMVAAAKAARQEKRSKPTVKRRKLDVAAGALQGSVSASKEKRRKGGIAPKKKKAQTITELATRDFIAIEADKQSSLMEGFLSQTTPTESAASEENKNNDKGNCQIRKEPRHGVSDRQLVAAVKRPISRVLPPEAAIQAAGCQDLLFGTSSQLVRDDSPSFIRDLQHALRESEASASQEDAVRQEATVRPKRTLWDAATRDLEGSLLESEAIDVTKTSEIKGRTTAASLGAFRQSPPLRASGRQITLMEPVTGLTAIAETESARNSARSSEDGHERVPLIDLPKSLAEAACRIRPRSRSPVKKSTSPRKREAKAKGKEAATRESGPDLVAHIGKVDYNKWTVAELSKKIRSYGFKAVKGKSNMVALLEKCSASMSEQALAVAKDQSPQLDGDNHAVVALPRKRGRPKKLDILANEGASCTATRQASCASKASSEQRPDVIAATKPAQRSDERREPASAAVRDATASATAKTLASVEVPARAASLALTHGQAHNPVWPRGRADPTQKNGRNIPAMESVSGSNSNPCTTSSDGVCDGEAIAAVGNAALPVIGARGDADQDPDMRLLKAITIAVTTFPPTHNPRQPTWHEKILMYDPIVLEDLAVWLNTVGLNRIGVDEEVWPSLVRQWCEKRSICCLWRENLRGGTRSRY